MDGKGLLITMTIILVIFLFGVVFYLGNLTNREVQREGGRAQYLDIRLPSIDLKGLFN